MMWVEVLSRHHDVLARTRCDDGARIGRAYDNDVVIDSQQVNVIEGTVTSAEI